jgi:hypothetical protein
MKKQELKTYTLNELIDKYIGEIGTAKRDDYENDLRIGLNKYNHNKLLTILNKQIENLSKIQLELLDTSISAEDFNNISELINNVKEYIINCQS